MHLPVEQDSVTSVYIYVRFSRREALKISIYSLHAVYYSYRRVNWLSFFGKREKGCGLRGWTNVLEPTTEEKMERKTKCLNVLKHNGVT